MKTTDFVIIIFIIISLAFSQIYSQDTLNTNVGESFYISVGAGVTTFSLKEVDDFYNDIIETYRNIGFPLIIQRQNPGNIVFNFSIARDFSSDITGGLRFQHTWTGSYALYSDAIGNLDVVSKIFIAKFDGFIGVNLADAESNVQPAFEFILGGLNFNYDLRQTAKVGEPVIQNSETKISFNDLIPSLEILFCLKYKIGIIGLTGMTGYRYAKTSEVHAYSYNDGILVDDGKLKLEVDLSGFNLLFGIELEL